MIPLTSLWLPILLSAVIVFVASSVIWMALPIHRKDWKGLPDENALLAALKKANVAPGLYMFPWCDGGKAKDAASKEKTASGPWGQIIVNPGPYNMGRMLSIWFLYLLLLSTFVAYVASITLHSGDPYLKVFQVTGSCALLGYGGGILPKFIWEGKPWSLFPGAMFDAVVYFLLTAGTFGWLWPR